MSISNPPKRASYSTLLLVAGNSNMIAIWNEWLSGLVSTNLALARVCMNDPSTWSFQGGLVDVLCSGRKVSSTTKSAKACALIAVVGA